MKKILLILILLSCEVASAEDTATIHLINSWDGSIIMNGSASVDNGTVSVWDATTNGTITYSRSEISSGKCIITASADGFYNRMYIDTIPFERYVYLPPKNESSIVQFSLIDYTNHFNYLNTYLEVSRISFNDNWVVSETYFDAAGYCTVPLVKGINYRLTLVTDGYTRSVGNFIPTADQNIALVVGEVDFVPSFSAYNEFEYNISKTNTTVTLNWIDPKFALINPFQYRIYDMNNTLVYSLDSNTTAGTATYTYAKPEEQYKIVLTANTTAGEVYHSEYVKGKTNLVDIQTSQKWYNMISIFGIFVIALCFGARSASIGAFITAIFSTGLYAIGFLQVSGLIISLVVVLGLLAVFRGRTA